MASETVHLVSNDTPQPKYPQGSTGHKVQQKQEAEVLIALTMRSLSELLKVDPQAFKFAMDKLKVERERLMLQWAENR